MKKIFLYVVMLMVTVSGCQSRGIPQVEPPSYLHQENSGAHSLGQVTPLSETTTVIPTWFQNTRALNLDTTAVLLMDETQHIPIYVEAPYKKIYPASLTKIMTALLVLEYGHLEEEVIVQQNFDHLIANAKKSGIEVGDRLTVEQLLNGLLINSGNDCAIVLAEHISGSVTEFAQRMTQKAVELGAVHTHFTNPHGLHDEGNYTTAYDLYLIFNEALKDPRFNQIIQQDHYEVTYNNAEDKEIKRTWYSTNLFFHRYDLPTSMEQLGGKTGFVTESGYNLILRSDRGNKTYISLVIGAKSKEDLYESMIDLLNLVTP